MSRIHNALSTNVFDFSEKALESKAFNANETLNARPFNAHANAFSMMNMHTLVC